MKHTPLSTLLRMPSSKKPHLHLHMLTQPIGSVTIKNQGHIAENFYKVRDIIEKLILSRALN